MSEKHVLEIDFKGDDPRRSGSSPSPKTPPTPSGATPVQSSGDVVREAFQYEASGLAGGAEAMAGTFGEGVGAIGAEALAGGAAVAAAPETAGLSLLALAAMGGGGDGGNGGGGSFTSMFNMGAGGGFGLTTFSDSIDLVIQGFQALYDSAMALDDTMMSIVEDIRPFSLSVASASAQYDVDAMMAMIHRADVLGPETARYLNTRSDINVAITEINTTLASYLLPLVNEGTRALADLVMLANLANELNANAWEMLGGPEAVGRFLAGSTGALSKIREHLREIARLKQEEKGLVISDKLDKLFGGLTGFGGSAGPMGMGGTGDSVGGYGDKRAARLARNKSTVSVAFGGAP